MVDKSTLPKFKWLQSLNHDEFLEQALLPLFRRMGYEKIAHRHPEGKNLDAMLRYEDSFGEIIYAFLQAKLPALSSDNLDIQNEILANFERTFADKNGVEFKPKECIIATTGQIGDEVVQMIQSFSSEYHYYVRLLDGEKILQLAKRYWMDWALEEYTSEDGFYGMIGRSPQMRKVFEMIKDVATMDIPVLIIGETGTGKELTARALHYHSPRANIGEFVSISCAAIPTELSESQMFGHEKGAFTGATSRHIGKFEEADGGTLLLDEIGELSPQLQTGLLRVLEEKVIERVGGQGRVPVDVRVLATALPNLETRIIAGDFSPALYFRLNTFVIHIPPLRERTEDIPLLAEYFLKVYSKEYDKSFSGFTKEAMDMLCEHHWPGNVRELKNIIAGTVIKSQDIVISPDDLYFSTKAKSKPSKDISLKIGTSLQEAERELILRTLEYFGGNKSKTAEILGITSKTIRRKLPGLRDLRYLKESAKHGRMMERQIDKLKSTKKAVQEKQEDSEKVKDFLQKAGFSVDEEMNALQFSVSSDNPALKRYGKIPVKILHHSKPTPESIREFYSDCRQNDVAENGLGFITVPLQLDTAVAMQIFVHRSESRFTIVPFTIYAIERALYEDRCLKTVLDTIKLWKGEADLFGLSTPIRDSLWFVGREKVMDEIQEYIQNLQFVGVLGVRKVGKTSLLYQLTHKLENDVHSYVDLQAVSSNVCALFSKVLDGFERDIKLKFPDIELPKLGETFKKTSDGIISGFSNAIVKLRDRVEGERKNTKFILFIDEVDRLFPNAEGDASGFSDYRSFLAAIRGLSQNYGFFVCVASGVEPTINLALLPGAGSVENPTYNFFKEVYLSYFEQQEMDEMIERIASQLGITFTEAALNFVYEQTCGHPYLSRLLCSAIMKIREKKPKITINEARQGLKFLLSSPISTEGTRHLRWLWDYLLDEEKEVIRKAKTSELEAFLSASDEKESLKEAVNKLIRLGYLEPTEEGYRILPPIFEKYLVGMGLI